MLLREIVGKNGRMIEMKKQPIPNFNRVHIEDLLEKHARADVTKGRNKLVDGILESLGLEGTCSMKSILNSDIEEERTAARNMIQKNLDSLLSDNIEDVKKTQEKIGDFYYCVDQMAPNPA